MGKESRLYEVAINLLPGIGGTLTRHLVSYCGSAQQVFSTPPGKLLKIPGIGQTHVKNIISKNYLTQAEAILKQAEKEEAQILFYTQPDFPTRLKQIADAPPLLYYRGTANLNHAKIISIVGTRQCTPYGKEVTEKIVQDLAKHNVLILSGLAYGIDITAHRAAIQANLPTVGVMASGLDIIYPAVHRKIAEKMIQNGGLLTENPFGTKPDAPRFPARNRIIAGLADATIVVEAAIKGGALITADIAHSYNKDVMAVPGNINAPVSEGCNMLIKTNKAAMYTNLRDLEELLNWDLENMGVGRSLSLFSQNKYPESDFSPEEYRIIQVLQETNEEVIDNICWKARVAISQVASLLLGLEFKGVIKALPGKKYQLL